MPPPAADLEEALKKKGGLTLTQLANYDDLVTDALVDKVYFWSDIRKLRANYHPCRGVQEESVCKILQHHVIVNKDPAVAQEELLKLPGLAKYHRNLKTTDEKEHFVRHLRKYINMYLPDCPFEVGTTNRYTIMTAEAAIIARRPIRKGEPIKYLSGIQVEMTEKEEKDLCSRTDFSIVLSSRRKRPSLFLGPARFANHDCDSNAKLNTTGPHGIHIVARKDIATGEEITVTYGLDYFGEDNCECLCGTCESLSRNGWDPRGPILNDSSDEESENEGEERDDDGEDLEATNHVSLTKRMNASVSSGKRKREDDEDDDQSPSLDGEGRGKRGRGRPRKISRSTGRAVTQQQIKDDAEASWIADDTVESPARGRNFLSSSAGQSLGMTRPGSAVTDMDFFPQYQGSRGASHQDSLKLNRVKADDTALRICRMLHDIAERRERNNKEAGSERVPEISTSMHASRGDIAISTEADEISTLESEMTTSEHGTTQARNADEDRSKVQSLPGRHGNTISYHRATEHVASKLPVIRKDHNFSRLRNVVNADDTRHPFSISTSPAPQLETAKCEKGRPWTSAAPEEESSDVNTPSPSFAGNDSASYVSASSSATSVDIFAAGSIAENICEMFTTGIKTEAEEPVAEPSRRRKTRDNARLQHLECQSRDRPLEKTLSLSPEKLDKGREPPRRSIRTNQSDMLSTPPVRSIERTDVVIKDDEDDDEDVKRGPVRTPGDYTLCAVRLAMTYHRWVECRNCDEYFVQKDAYLTRIACPRCERHSKLYGYYWPKTDKEGKNDKDIRILDHRTIHRFIDPEEERSERKGRRTLAHVLMEKELSARQESEESDRADKRLRISPRRSESRRKLRSTM